MATEKDMDVAHVEAEAALQQSITADEHPGKNGVHHLYLDVTLDPELERQLTYVAHAVYVFDSIHRPLHTN